MSVPFVMFDWCVKSNCFKSSFFPGRYDLIIDLSIYLRHVGEELHTFHPTRPLVRWSRVENRFASRKGGSNDVDAVIPNARFFVTAYISISVKLI